MNKFACNIAFYCALGALSSGCVPVVVGTAAVGSFYVGQDERRFGTITNDASITTEINARYVRDDLVKAREINVDTYDGIVTLTGNVNGSVAKQRAVSLANEVIGVKNVISKLTVL